MYLYLLVLGLKMLDLGTLLYSQEFGEEEEEIMKGLFNANAMIEVDPEQRGGGGGEGGGGGRFIQSERSELRGGL